MTKRTTRSALIQDLAAGAAAQLADQVQEQAGGFPSATTEDALAADEINRPLTDSDFFDYCEMAFIRKGKAIVYYIKKDGKYKTTLKPPLNWDKLRNLFGAGHYLVQAKDELTNAFLKQKTEILDEMPAEDVGASGGDSGFSFGAAPAQPDFTPFLAMMQQQDQRRSQMEHEQRLRDETYRREERERDELRRREERDNKNDLLKSAMALAPTLLAAFGPKKDEKTEVILEIMKESQRNQQTQTEKLMDKLERIMTTPLKPETNALDLIKQLNEARKEGREEMRDLMDMVEERATERAQEMKGGDGEESTLALLLKNVGPGLAALLAQGRGVAPPVLANDDQEALEAPEQVVEAAPVAAAPVAPVKKVPPTTDELDQAAILKTVLPFLAEQFQRMGSNHSIDPKASARETLALLKTKGFHQKRVLELFTRETLFGVLRAYKLPKEYDPWFNQYYGALVIQEPEAPLRTRASGSPQSIKPQTRNKPFPARVEGKSSGNGAGESQPASGFVPSSTAKPEILSGNGVDSEPRKLAGTSSEGQEPLLT